jgi:outer membrane lipoprotein-sorting protein
MNRPALVILGIALSAPAWPKPAGELDAVLDRMDRAAAAFKSMSAKIRRISHTAVVNEDNVDSGSILLKRGRGHEVRMLIELTQPDPKSVEFQGHTVDIYYPKIQTVQEFDASKFRDLLDQFILLGFGTSRATLQDSYTISLVGTDTINGQKTDRLELKPKSKEVLQHLSKMEIWVAENGYPLQQKFYLPGGDYELATYSDMTINPNLPDAMLKLKLPPHVKKEYPQR